MKEVYPSSTFGESHLAFFGIHRIGTLGDGKKNSGDYLEIKFG